LHGRILDRLDLTAVSQLAPDELRQRLRQIVEQLTAAERLTTSEEERNAVVESVMDELIGLGPLESVLRDPTGSDVLVNGCERVYVERGGKLMPVDVRFRDNRHLTHTIQRIVARIGRRIDESSHGGCPTARRLTRQCGHSAARHRRTRAL